MTVAEGTKYNPSGTQSGLWIPCHNLSPGVSLHNNLCLQLIHGHCIAYCRLFPKQKPVHHFLNTGKDPLKFRKINGTSPDGGEAEWCSIYYTSPGGTYRTGQMSLNGGGKFNVYYPPTSAQISIPIRVNLKPGSENSIDLVIPSGVKVKHIIVY